MLIVEDDADTRLMLSTWMSLLDVPALTAKNGKDALRLARAHHPCLILLDLMLPEMGGEEFRLLQQSDAAIADVPVVLTSAHPRLREIAEELGVAGVVPKPLHPDDIERAVHTYCSDRKVSGERVAAEANHVSPNVA